MKKILAMLLAAMMVLSLAACNNNEGNTEKPGVTTVATEPAVAGPADSLEVMNTIWAGYNEEYKSYFAGGDWNNMVEGAPGNYDLTDAELVENMQYTLYIPAAEMANINQAATLQHFMNANNFTAGVVRYTGDAAAFAASMVDTLKNTQWICGQPELMTIAVIAGEYVLISFGNTDLMGEFNTQLTAVYPNAQIIENGPLF